MALTRDQIDDLAEDGVFLGNVYEIARAIEAEVRKQDDALILQMLEALEEVNQAMPFPVAARARAAARTRLAPSTEPASNSTRTTNDRL